jgi:peptide/nickel transport system ATP-binding protein
VTNVAGNECAACNNRAQILNLLKDLRSQFQLTYLFISHDLNVVQHLNDRVAVMYVGKIVELAPIEKLLNNIQLPYSEALSVAPTPDPRARRKRVLPRGEVADLADLPRRCYFHPRCQFTKDRCKTETPPLRETKPGHWAAYHFSEALKSGVQDRVHASSDCSKRHGAQLRSRYGGLRATNCRVPNCSSG